MAKLTAKEFQEILETSPIPSVTIEYAREEEADKYGYRKLKVDDEGRPIPVGSKTEYFYVGEAPEETEWAEECSWHEFTDAVDENGADVEGLGHITLVENFGGEGQGDQYYFVVKLSRPDNEDQFFLMPGWYASYAGGEYDGTFQEVTPKQKVVTVYE